MYRVLIYHHDEVVDDRKFKTIEAAAKYGETTVEVCGGSDNGYWFKVKVD